MRTKIVSICLLFSIIAIGEVQAACFDCSKVESPTWQLICSDKELSDADELLDKEFHAASQTSRYKDEFGDEEFGDMEPTNQYDWARFGTEPCLNLCPDAACILKMYRKKINVLKTQYLSYFYGKDKYTGIYRNENGGMSILLIPGNKIKFYVETDYCTIGENGNVIATLIDKNNAVYLDDMIEDCAVFLTFGKHRVTLSFTLACTSSYCGTRGVVEGVYLKEGNKPDFSEFINYQAKDVALAKRNMRMWAVNNAYINPDVPPDYNVCTGERLSLRQSRGRPH